MTGSVAAILLAGGKSRRMGRCKQLLPLGDSTVIERCLGALATGGVAEIVVVVSEEGQEVAEALRAYPVRIIVNTVLDGDMASSVRAGRDALATESSGVIVSLCDYPLVSAVTITRLIEEHGILSDKIIIPSHQGTRGHPLLFPRSILNELTNDLILRDLVRRDPKRVHSLDVGDPAVLIDMDTPEDYRRICAMMQSNKGPHEIYDR